MPGASLLSSVDLFTGATDELGDRVLHIRICTLKSPNWIRCYLCLRKLPFAIVRAPTLSQASWKAMNRHRGIIRLPLLSFGSKYLFPLRVVDIGASSGSTSRSVDRSDERYDRITIRPGPHIDQPDLSLKYSTCYCCRFICISQRCRKTRSRT